MSADLGDLESLLDRHGLANIVEEPFEHDGWSGARLTRLTRADGERFILKRDRLALMGLSRSERKNRTLGPEAIFTLARRFNSY